MRSIAYYWGMLGVVGLIASAVLRLSPRIWELTEHTLSPLHWLVLVVFTPYMAYAEGYKGFHLNFAPRVVARALYLRGLPQTSAGQLAMLTLLAPLFCMGFFHATRRRMVISWTLTTMIVALVIAVSHTPQPWRGIVDAGVVTGLALGMVSLLWHWLREEQPSVPLDLPADAA